MRATGRLLLPISDERPSPPGDEVKRGRREPWEVAHRAGGSRRGVCLEAMTKLAPAEIGRQGAPYSARFAPTELYGGLGIGRRRRPGSRARGASPPGRRAACGPIVIT